ncbi:hypothetical protein MPSEU_000372500 [Mayamaea pseudoterrestris]|nr:hypothetical protein MPSEU_000372500 [Mayamaea pseudoterrestris]
MPTKKKKLKGKLKKASRERSINELIKAAETAMLSQVPETAIDIYLQAASIAAAESNSIQLAFILEQSAHAKLSMADQDGAREDYQEALMAAMKSADALNPSHLEQIAGLNLYIGQLLDGQEALKHFKDGIEKLLTAVKLRQEHADIKMPSNDDDDDDPVLLLHESKRQLSSAYCAAADLFLTDLCYEENAEEECEMYVSLALQTLDASGEPSVDALQTATSQRLSQNRSLDAVNYALRMYEKMRLGCEQVSRLTGIVVDANGSQEDTKHFARELSDSDEALGLPEFEFRVQTAKLLIECSNALRKRVQKQEKQTEECAEAAVNVLGSLLAENDEVVEVCFLLGEAYTLLQQDAQALHFYERANHMLASILESLEEELVDVEEGDSDQLQQQVDSVTCQLDEITGKMEEVEKRLESLDEEAMGD